MKAEPQNTADGTAKLVKAGAAWFLFSLTLVFLYLVGTSQSFLETTQTWLFQALRWLSWIGFWGTACILLPLVRKHPRRLAVVLGLGTGFGAIFLFSLIWGSWIYPDLGPVPW